MMRQIGAYVDEDHLKHFDSYKYVSGTLSFADTKLTPFWNAAVKKVPHWIAPNTLTLLGWACSLVAVCVMSFFAPMLDVPTSRPVYFIVACLLFAYQTLDAIDGKHARQTNSSSPLGQLFDHGCDSYTTHFFGWLCASIGQFGYSFMSFLVMTILQLQMLLCIWYELQFGQFPTSSSSIKGISIGVTEGQLIVILLYLACAVFGGEIVSFSAKGHLSIPQFDNEKQGWMATLEPLVYVRAADVVWLLFVCGQSYIMFSESVDVFRRTNYSTRTKVQFGSLAIHLGFQSLYFYNGANIGSPFLPLMNIALYGSILALRLHVTAVCKLPPLLIHPPTLPLYGASVMTSVCKVVCGWYPSETVMSFVDYFLLVWALVYSAAFLICFITDTCNYLSISCFSVNKKSDSDKKK